MKQAPARRVNTRNSKRRAVSGGLVFRILKVPPGKDAFKHCTNTNDYYIVPKGECVMMLEAGSDVAMREGDVMKPRGAWHGWANRSDEPVRLTFVLISARPPTRRRHVAIWRTCLRRSRAAAIPGRPYGHGAPDRG